MKPATSRRAALISWWPTDADEVYARAQAAGAKFLRPIQDMDYGSREFTVKDPEGHSWSVGTYDPWNAH